MMEVAALLNITKNGFYRAMIIFQRACDQQPKLLHSKRLGQYVCGALSIGAKFECSGQSHLENIFVCNARRISKEDISLGESYILQVAVGLCRC